MNGFAELRGWASQEFEILEPSEYSFSLQVRLSVQAQTGTEHRQQNVKITHHASKRTLEFSSRVAPIRFFDPETALRISAELAGYELVLKGKMLRLRACMPDDECSEALFFSLVHRLAEDADSLERAYTGEDIE